MRSATASRTRERIDRLAGARLPWDAFAEEALEIFARGVGFDAAVMAPMDRDTGLITGSIKRELPDDSYPHFARYEYVAPTPDAFAALAQRGNPVARLRDETDGDPHRNARFDEFLAPRLAIAHEIRVAAVEGEHLLGGMSLFRSVGASDFDESVTELARLLAPTLARGLRGGPRTGPAPRSSHAVLVVDAANRLTASSADARSWVAILDPTGARPVPVPIVTAVTTARVHGVGELRIPSTAAGWVRVRATVVNDTVTRAPSVVVEVAAITGREGARLNLTALGLTRREREIVDLVLDGAATSEIARRLSLSPYTVQDHLKSVFAKAGLRSRRELVASLLG
ncbi:helix-turn-helix transcriptional regulator [uncultured Schumannella sp.]|uniref:helix-turn-helix domain-containing protein n=1 Tax=uncultured Schumannella sp. TaxID=1195956 RepID=UPI0025E46DBE|nr:helix-turn-helix transcriptional regulator [uncultured Schumannella sp.]